jgi:hypothetical protein
LKPAEGQELKSRMEVLYKLRVAADYRATDPMSANDAVTAIRESDIIVKIIQEWLP